MIQLVYASAATATFTPEALKLLLIKSRSRNEFHHVTGILLYDAGSFLQVLEGEEEDVELTFELVRHDRRHSNLKVFLQQRIEKREFGDWPMAFLDMSTWDAHTPGVTDYYRSLPTFISGPTAAKQYLRFFREGRFHQAAA